MAKSSLRGYNKKNAEFGDEQVRQKAQEILGENMDNNQINGVEDAQDMMKKYEDKSQDELMGDLKSMLDSGRQDGSFSEEMLNQFYQTAAPMMQGEQKEKLDNLVDMIKKGQL
jgi:hypothetical protein